MDKNQTQVFIVSISTRRARGDVFDALDAPFSIFTSITVNTHGSDPSFIHPLHTSVRPFCPPECVFDTRARAVSSPPASERELDARE